MTAIEALPVLEMWQTRMQECEVQMDALRALVLLAPEAPLPNAIYAVMGAYTRDVATLIGCCDEWLTAWWLEHNFGARPMQAGVVGEPLRTITTLAELAKLIADDIGETA